MLVLKGIFNTNIVSIEVVKRVLQKIRNSELLLPSMKSENNENITWNANYVIPAIIYNTFSQNILIVWEVLMSNNPSSDRVCYEAQFVSCFLRVADLQSRHTWLEKYNSSYFIQLNSNSPPASSLIEYSRVQSLSDDSKFCITFSTCLPVLSPSCSPSIL